MGERKAKRGEECQREKQTWKDDRYIHIWTDKRWEWGWRFISPFFGFTVVHAYKCEAKRKIATKRKYLIDGNGKWETWHVEGEENDDSDNRRWFSVYICILYYTQYTNDIVMWFLQMHTTTHKHTKTKLVWSSFILYQSNGPIDIQYILYIIML